MARTRRSHQERHGREPRMCSAPRSRPSAGAGTRQDRALAITEAACGPDHPSVATDLNNLALILRELGDLAGARPLQERALAITEAACGPDHPSVATGLNNLALILRELGDLAGARPLQERALAITEAVGSVRSQDDQ